MSQLLSVKYDVIWNGNPAKWEQANTLLWERLASANATRVILEEPKSYMVRDIPEPTSDYEDYEVDDQSYKTSRSTTREEKIDDEVSFNHRESNVASSTAAATEPLSVPGMKSQKARNEVSSSTSQLVDYKTWLDYQTKRDIYLEKWDQEESRAYKVLTESIGSTGKAMISEFKLKVGESTRGQPAKIWKALVKLNDMHPAYSAAEVLKSIVNCRVLQENYPMFCDTFDRYIVAYETKIKRSLGEDELLGYFVICLDSSKLPDVVESAYMQFRRQGMPYSLLKVKLLEEDARMRARKPRTNKEIALLTETNVDASPKYNGKGKNDRRQGKRRPAEAAESEIVGNNAMSCQITGNKSEYILCTYCKRNHRGGASNCHVRMRDLIAKDEAEKKTSADAKLSVIQAEIGEVTRKSNLKLDTCASMHFTGDINKLEDISVGEPIRVNGFDGNSKVSNIYGNIPDLGRAVYIAGMPSTLISLGSLKDNGFDVSFDDKTSSFQVSKGDVELRFNKSESNIWTGDFIEAMECVACNSDVSNTPMVRSTTNEELDRFDKLDIIHRNLHHPSDAVLKRMIRNGKIIGTPCVASDVDKYREKYGLCEGCAKGKMTAKAAHPSLTPRSSKCGDLVHVDLMFVGGFIFIVAVDDYSRKKIVVEVASKQKADIIH